MHVVWFLFFLPSLLSCFVFCFENSNNSQGYPETILKAIFEQEATLQFRTFSNEDGIELGLALLAHARIKVPKVPLVIDVRRFGGAHVFHVATDGTNADYDSWVTRKRNVVERFGHSSYYMSRTMVVKGRDLAKHYSLEEKDYVASGGSFPILVKGVGMIGTVTLCGMPEADDHGMVVEVLKNIHR